MLYYLVFVAQILNLICNILYMFDSQRMEFFFKASAILFVISFLMMIAAVVTGSRASRANCFTLLLFMVNLTLIVLYMFTGFLGGFMQSSQ
ncbi:MAG: hypothetical protein ACXWW0_02935 [Bacteroidia bacterium]